VGSLIGYHFGTQILAFFRKKLWDSSLILTFLRKNCVHTHILAVIFKNFLLKFLKIKPTLHANLSY